MYSEIVYKHSKVPKVTSDYWDQPVNELFEEYLYFRDARQELEKIVWPACARAYLCRRDLPKSKGMAWADQSDYGETDIWDGVNYRSKSLVNNLMPRNEDWQALLSAADEDASIQQDVQDYLASVHRAADTRGAYEKHGKQIFIYGTSGIGWRWERRFDYQTFGPAETSLMLQAQGYELDPDEDITQTYKKYSFQIPRFNGPVVRPVEMYDLLIDPLADLSNQTELSTIVRTYWTPEDLKRSVLEDGKTKRFGNLDGLEAMTLAQIYGHDEERFEISVELGINAIATRHYRQKYVPVYIFHKQLRNFDCNDDTFVDTYFYVAGTGTIYSNRIIAVEQNPLKKGSRSVFIDTYEDWISGGYGIGAVEKSLSDYNKKNVMSALHLNASLASVFPAYTVIGGILQDDRKLSTAPGGLNVINYKPAIGTNFIAPVPVPKDGVQMGEQVQQWYSQKILGQMGAYGSILQDPNKTVEQSKTATQINTESTTGGIAEAALLEKITIRSLEPLCQAIYDAARQYCTDDIIEFERERNGDVSLGQLTKDILDVDRKVVVTGYHATLNKQAEIEERREALNVLTTGNALQVMPNGVPILQELVLSLLGRLNVPNMDQFRQDPVQLVMQDQRVQAELNQITTQKAQEMVAQLAGLQPPQEVNQPIPPPPNAVSPTQFGRQAPQQQPQM